MTIKGKRAGALRKMDNAEVSSYMLGGWVDETFSADEVHAALAGLDVDLGSFDTFLGPRLGLFRDLKDYSDTKPAIAEEKTLVEEAMQYVQQTRTRLEHLPPAAEARINTVCWNRHGETFDDRRRRLDAELQEVWNLLVLTERKLEPSKAAGRKSASHRDRLLHDLAHWLADRGSNVTRSANAAAAVLRAVGIDAPDDPKKARAIVRAVETGAENNR